MHNRVWEHIPIDRLNGKVVIFTWNNFLISDKETFCAMSQLPLGKNTSSQKLNRRKWLQTGSAGIAGLTVSQNTVSASNSKERSRGNVPLLRMSPPLFVGSTDAERTQFLRRVRTMRVRTVSMATPASWSEKQVEEARQFLDNHGLQVGEFSGFHGGFASLDAADNKAALDHYRRQYSMQKSLAHTVSDLPFYAAVFTTKTWLRSLLIANRKHQGSGRIPFGVTRSKPHVN